LRLSKSGGAASPHAPSTRLRARFGDPSRSLRTSLGQFLPWLALAGLCFLAAVLRWPDARRQLEYDEVIAILFARHDFADIVRGTAADTMPPLYYWLLHLWAPAGDDLAWARLLSTLLGAASVPAVYLIGRRLLDYQDALAGAGLMAISPFPAFYGHYARMYALLTLLGLLAFLFFVRWLQDGRRRDLVLFTVAAGLSLYVHNLAFLLLIALDLLFAITALRALLNARQLPAPTDSGEEGTAYRLLPTAYERGRVAWLFLAHLALALGYLPWLAYLPGQLEKVAQAFWIPPPGLLELVRTPLVFLFHLPLPELMVGPAAFVALLCVAVTALETWRCWRGVDLAQDHPSAIERSGGGGESVEGDVAIGHATRRRHRTMKAAADLSLRGAEWWGSLWRAAWQSGGGGDVGDGPPRSIFAVIRGRGTRLPSTKEALFSAQSGGQIEAGDQPGRVLSGHGPSSMAPKPDLLPLAAVALLPIALMFLISQARPVYVERAVLVSAAAYYLLLAAAVRRVPLRPLAWGIAGLIGLGMAAAHGYQYAYEGFPRSPYYALADQMSADLRTGEVVLHDNKLSYFPTYFLAPALPQTYLADPPGSANDTLAPGTIDVLGLPPSSLERAVQGTSKVWFVIYTRALDEAAAAGRQHEHKSWLDQRYRGELRHQIGDLQVWLYHVGSL